MLTRLAVAAVIAGAAVPGLSAEMPDFGTKNFSPGGDTPAYFSNENGAFGLAAAEATDDGGENAAMRSLPNEPSGRAVGHARHRAGVTFERRSPHRVTAQARSAVYQHRAGVANTHAATARTRAGSAHAPGPSVRHASARYSAHRGHG
jgi:hypothetical protein